MSFKLVVVTTLVLALGIMPLLPKPQSKSIEKGRALAALSQQEMMIAYNLLANQEKVEIWVDRWQKLVKTGTLTPDQLAVVTDLITTFEEPGFGLGDDLESSTKMDVLAYRAGKVFSRQEQLDYFYSLTNLESTVTVMTQLGAPPPNCSCNSKAGLTHCLTNTLCTEGQNACVELSTGCGLALQQKCDGMCKAIVEVEDPGGGGIN